MEKFDFERVKSIKDINERFRYAFGTKNLKIIKYVFRVDFLPLFHPRHIYALPLSSNERLQAVVINIAEMNSLAKRYEKDLADYQTLRKYLRAALILQVNMFSSGGRNIISVREADAAKAYYGFLSLSTYLGLKSPLDDYIKEHPEEIPAFLEVAKKWKLGMIIKRLKMIQNKESRNSHFER